ALLEGAGVGADQLDTRGRYVVGRYLDVHGGQLPAGGAAPTVAWRDLDLGTKQTIYDAARRHAEAHAMSNLDAFDEIVSRLDIDAPPGLGAALDHGDVDLEHRRPFGPFDWYSAARHAAEID